MNENRTIHLVDIPIGGKAWIRLEPPARRARRHLRGFAQGLRAIVLRNGERCSKHVCEKLTMLSID